MTFSVGEIVTAAKLNELANKGEAGTFTVEQIFQAGITVGSGQTLMHHYHLETDWFPNTVAAGSHITTTFSMGGVLAQDMAVATHNQLGNRPLILNAHIPSADTVKLLLQNIGGSHLTVNSGTLAVSAFRG